MIVILLAVSLRSSARRFLPSVIHLESPGPSSGILSSVYSAFDRISRSASEGSTSTSLGLITAPWVHNGPDP